MNKERKTIKLYEYNEAVAMYKEERKQEILDTINNVCMAASMVAVPILLIAAWVIFGY